MVGVDRRTSVATSARTGACASEPMCVRVCVCVHVCMYVCVCVLSVYVCVLCVR